MSKYTRIIPEEYRVSHEKGIWYSTAYTGVRVDYAGSVPTIHSMASIALAAADLLGPWIEHIERNLVVADASGERYSVARTEQFPVVIQTDNGKVTSANVSPKYAGARVRWDTGVPKRLSLGDHTPFLRRTCPIRVLCCVDDQGYIVNYVGLQHTQAAALSALKASTLE